MPPLRRLRVIFACLSAALRYVDAVDDAHFLLRYADALLFFALLLFLRYYLPMSDIDVYLLFDD